MAVPVALGVNVTEHVPSARVHEAALKLPAAPVLVNDTLPVGVVAVPGEVSVTVVVHVDACPTNTGLVHDTAVADARTVTVIEPEPELVACIVSPLYDPVMVAVPVAVPVNVTEHEPATSAQDAALRLPAEPVAVKLTEPVGVVTVPGEVSATVAVQVDATPTGTGLVHATVVEVALGLTVRLLVPELDR